MGSDYITIDEILGGTIFDRLIENISGGADSYDFDGFETQSDSQVYESDEFLVDAGESQELQMDDFMADAGESQELQMDDFMADAGESQELQMDDFVVDVEEPQDFLVGAAEPQELEMDDFIVEAEPVNTTDARELEMDDFVVDAEPVADASNNEDYFIGASEESILGVDDSIINKDIERAMHLEKSNYVRGKNSKVSKVAKKILEKIIQ